MRRRQFERLLDRWDLNAQRRHEEWREESKRRHEENKRRHEDWREESKRRHEENERRHEDWREEMREWREAEKRRSEEWWAEWRTYRIEQNRRLHAIEAAVANETRLTRDILVQMREDRMMMRDMRHGIQATTEGLLRVLDEFRRGDGPSTAGA